MINKGNRSGGRKSFPIVTLSTINTTWTVLEMNPDLCSENSVTVYVVVQLYTDIFTYTPYI
jgi:hypothetical protein